MRGGDAHHRRPHGRHRHRRERRRARDRQSVASRCSGSAACCWSAARKGAVAGFDIDQVIDKQIILRGTRGHSFGAVELALRTMASSRFPLERMSSHVVGLERGRRGLRRWSAARAASARSTSPSRPGAEREAVLKPRGQRAPGPRRRGHADGRAVPPLLAAGAAVVRIAGAGRRAGARAAARRGSDRVPRHATAASAWSMRSAPIAARRCSSAATRNAACAASITAGSSTSTATASTCRPSPPTRR